MLNLNPAFTDIAPTEVPTLLAQAQAGDADAFGALCRAFETRLLRQAITLCGDVSVAEDLAQDTLVEAWKCLGRYNGECQFFTWLCAILHNRHRNLLRRKRLLLLFGTGGSERNERPGVSDQQADEDSCPDQAAQSRDQAALVRRCVQALSAKHQQVIYLRFFVDDSLEGIAAALGCSIGTVKSRLFHALDKLRGMHALNQQCDYLNKKVGVL